MKTLSRLGKIERETNTIQSDTKRLKEDERDIDRQEKRKGE